MVHFSETEIKLAKQLREHGLAWEPTVGHYVYDETGICEKGSPFQDRVYFILNYAYFMHLVGGVNRFKEAMVWLPTWEDLRVIVRDCGYSDTVVADYLAANHSIERGAERLDLYQLVDNHLRGLTLRQIM